MDEESYYQATGQETLPMYNRVYSLDPGIIRKQLLLDFRLSDSTALTPTMWSIDFLRLFNLFWKKYVERTSTFPKKCVLCFSNRKRSDPADKIFLPGQQKMGKSTFRLDPAVFRE